MINESELDKYYTDDGFPVTDGKPIIKAKDSVAYLQLECYAKTEDQKTCILSAIQAAINIKEYLDETPTPTKQDKVKAINKKIESLYKDLASYYDDERIKDYLFKLKVKIVLPKAKIIKSVTTEIKDDLLECGFSPTRIDEDILPTLMQLIKDKL